jgi:hypothetical protein
MAFSQKNRVKVAKAIANRQEFDHASMSGEWVSNTSWFNWGRLNNHPETKAEIENLLKDRDLYMVFSYVTPIAYAWDKEIHVLPHRYSPTTDDHQSIVSLADHYATAY